MILSYSTLWFFKNIKSTSILCTSIDVSPTNDHGKMQSTSSFGTFIIITMSFEAYSFTSILCWLLRGSIMLSDWNDQQETKFQKGASRTTYNHHCYCSMPWKETITIVKLMWESKLFVCVLNVIMLFLPCWLDQYDHVS